MVEKLSDALKRTDLDLILEINKKAIEIETEVAEQNEEIIESLDKVQDFQKNSETELEKRMNAQDEKLNKLIIQGDENSKDLFRMKVLYVGGFLALLAQIVEIFLKK